jgi:hypothetical protein
MTESESVDLVAEFKRQIAGKWGALRLPNCPQSQRSRRHTHTITLDTFAGPNTLSDPSSKSKLFNAFLYNRKIIIRELQPSPKAATSETASASSPAIVEKHRVRCCHCLKVWSDRKPNDTSTSIYIRHIREKHRGKIPADEKEEKQMLLTLMTAENAENTEHAEHAEHANTGPNTGPRGAKRQRSNSGSLITPWTLTQRQRGAEHFTEDRYRVLLLHFLIETNSSFSIVESNSFRELMSFLNSKISPLSRRTMTRELHKYHESMVPRIKASLSTQINSGGRIHITLDGWTASNGTPYLGVTAHWLDAKWQALHDVVLDLVRLQGSHTTENLTNALMNTLRYYGIQKALGCVTCDNAAVMPALCRALEQQIPAWKKRDGHVRCMPHILNLVVQKILKKLHCQRDEDELEADLAEADGWDGDSSPGSVLKKVRCIVAKIRASHNLAEALQREATAVELKYLRPKMDMKVR